MGQDWKLHLAIYMRYVTQSRPHHCQQLSTRWIDQLRPSYAVGGWEGGGWEGQPFCSNIYIMQQKNSAGICVHAIIIRCARRITTLQELISVYRTATLQEYISTRSAAISVQGNAQVSWAHRGHGIPKHWPDRRIGVIVLSNIRVLSLLA